MYALSAFRIFLKVKYQLLTYNRLSSFCWKELGIFEKSLQTFFLPSTPFQRVYTVHFPFRVSLCLSAMADNCYIVGYAKLGTSSCKKCKQKIEKGSLRIGKVTANPFSEDGGNMKHWFHPSCIFETFLKARISTKVVEEPDDLDGFTDLQQEDKNLINTLIKEFSADPKNKRKTIVQPLNFPKKNKTETPASSTEFADDAVPSTSAVEDPSQPNHNIDKDSSFRQFRQLCANIAEENSYLGKTQLVSNFLEKKSFWNAFKGDIYLWVKMLLPGVIKVVYNLNNKQLVKLFSQIFSTSQEEMIEDLEQGDVAETLKIFFEQSRMIQPQKKSTLLLQEVDSLLNDLSRVTKEDDQQRILTKITKRCTANDFKMVVRLIKHDLRINAGAKHILDGVDPNAYAAFQASRNLRDVVDRVLANRREAEESGKPLMSKCLSVRASLMTPVLPMLAEVCRSVKYALKKCPNGFYAEIKYDGERVQVHKKGLEFCYFSRSLKSVQSHKVAHFKDYIPKAFPGGDDLILDAEVLLIDAKTCKPLPFGTLGIHKKTAFSGANVCLFVFDCLHINGQNLMDMPIKKRKKILHKNMQEIPNRIMFSEMHFITKPEDLQCLMKKVFDDGLEGLVLKDVNSIYEPGKRHWLKVKKDYLEEGRMADSADLVVLGAYYGTGNKGGLMSVFLMGVYNPAAKNWCTVTKVGNGFDDKTLDCLQTELDMVKISKDMSKVPVWLNVKKHIVPDFIVVNPKTAPVWKIVGAEFSKAEIHTADGISIRFPRVINFRDDRSWKDATDLPRLKMLFKKSKEASDFVNLTGEKTEANKSDDIENISDCENSNESAVHIKESMKRKIKLVETTPIKKGKILCKYGANSYQKSPGHLEKFSHLNAEKNISTLPATSTKLPDFFRGVKIFLPEDLKDYKQLKRYIIAFDGDVVADCDMVSATHIIVDEIKNKDNSISGIHVTPKWLWQCIQKKKMISTDTYKVS